MTLPDKNFASRVDWNLLRTFVEIVRAGGVGAAARRLKPLRTLFTHIGHDLDHEETNATLPAGFELAYDGLQISTPGG